MNEIAKVIDENGLPTWSGTDSIYNSARDQRRGMGMYGIAAIAMGLFFALPISSVLSWDPITEGAGVFIGLLAWLMILIGLGFALFAFAVPELIKTDWTLRASADGKLAYTGVQWGDFSGEKLLWVVAVQRVARVESGATREWEGERRFGFKPLPIREHEFQAYLFLDDGRRLVVATIDHGREATGALAQSIRTWVEAHNRSAKPAARPDGPVPEGFDI